MIRRGDGRRREVGDKGRRRVNERRGMKKGRMASGKEE